MPTKWNTSTLENNLVYWSDFQYFYKQVGDGNWHTFIFRFTVKTHSFIKQVKPGFTNYQPRVLSNSFDKL